MPNKNLKKKNALIAIPSERIMSKIFFIRDKKVMIDRDLAELYGVETKALNRAVKRNIERFPPDFMFQLTNEEFDSLRCQFGTSNESRGGRRYAPLAFTEHGILMLSSALRSKRAIQVNIQIMRMFIRLKEMLLTHTELGTEIDKIEKKFDKKLTKHDQQFKAVFDAIKRLISADTKPKAEIGFKS